MKKLTLVAILLITFGFTACGKIQSSQIKELAKELETAYQVKIEANIHGQRNPVLYVKAKDIEIDRVNKRLTVKDMGFLTSVTSVMDDNYFFDHYLNFAIKEENTAVFSVPLGGKITIKHPDGKIEILEQY